jgi:hypothetical protein
MSILSSPASVAAKPEPEPDPSVVAQRQAVEAAANAKAEEDAKKARQQYAGRTMGTQGANALFTGSAAGYGRTMGAANV